MTVINEKLIKKLTKNDTREVSLKELKALNKISIRKGYNRNIYFHKFFKDLKKNMLKDTSKFGFWNAEKTTRKKTAKKTAASRLKNTKILNDAVCENSVSTKSY